LGGVKTTSAPFGKALQLVSRISELITASTTFNCAVAVRPQDDPSLALTLRVNAPAGNVAAVSTGVITSNVEAGGTREVEFNVDDTPAGRPLTVKPIDGGAAEPAASAIVTVKLPDWFRAINSGPGEIEMA
jgi:hypothetical protein